MTLRGQVLDQSSLGIARTYENERILADVTRVRPDIRYCYFLDRFNRVDDQFPSFEETDEKSVHDGFEHRRRILFKQSVNHSKKTVWSQNKLQGIK